MKERKNQETEHRPPEAISQPERARATGRGDCAECAGRLQGFALLLPPRGPETPFHTPRASGHHRWCPRGPPALEAGCTEEHAVASPGDTRWVPGRRCSVPWVPGSPWSLAPHPYRRLGPHGFPGSRGSGSQRPRPPSPASAPRLGLRRTALQPPARGCETDTDISPTPVITRGQELWPRSHQYQPPRTCGDAVSKKKKKKKFKTENGCLRPLRRRRRGSQRPRARCPRAPGTATRSPARRTRAHPLRAQGTARGPRGPRRARPSSASSPATPSSPPAWMVGEKAGVGWGHGEERGEKGTGVGGGEKGERVLLPGFST